MSLFIFEKWLMVLTYTLSSKDLADRFAFGRSGSVFGDAPMYSFHLALSVSL